MEIIQFVIDGFMGLVFCFAASSKITRIRDTSLNIQSYRVIPQHLSILGAFLLIGFEFILGVAFCFNWIPDIKYAMTVLILIVFSFISWRKSRSTKEHDCNCFGNVSWLNQYPLLRNLCLIGVLAFGWFVSERNSNIPIDFVLFSSLLSIITLLQITQTAKKYKRYQVQ